MVGTKTPGADVDTSGSAINGKGGTMGIWLPRPLGMAFRVAYIVAKLAGLAAEFTSSWQYSAPVDTDREDRVDTCLVGLPLWC